MFKSVILGIFLFATIAQAQVFVHPGYYHPPVVVHPTLIVPTPVYHGPVISRPIIVRQPLFYRRPRFSFYFGF